MSRVIEELTALAKVEARRRGRAVRISNVLRVDPDSDAFLLTPIKMAGEGRLWAAAFGRRDEAPEFVSCPDARDRDDETANVIQPLTTALDDYFQECLESGSAPQVWVSSGAAVRFLDVLSERRVSRYDAGVARFGHLLHFLADRYFYAGQQVLLPATEVLGRHFATGQSPLEDQHLGAFLAWVDPPESADAEAAARAAEELPAGVNTDVLFDIAAGSMLTELSELPSKARKRRREIEIALRGELERAALRIHGWTERAIEAIDRQGLPSVDGMEKLRADDLNSFEFFMTRDFVPLRSSADEAGRQLSAREAAIDASESIFIQMDHIERSLALHEGEVVEGQITDLVYGSRAGSVHELTFGTAQLISKLRVGDTVRLDATKNIALQLIEQGPPDSVGVRELRFRVRNGKTSVGEYLDEEVALLPLASSFFNRSRRPPQTPWIIDRRGVPSLTRGRKPPKDPVAALERLR